jgi:2-oxoglutarate dehydrogenase E1 component
VNKVVAAARLVRMVREMGHLAARLDPLGSEPPGDPSLELATHGLTAGDLAALPASVVGGPLAKTCENALGALGKLRRAYSGAVGYEDDHIHMPEERDWLRHAAETGRFFQGFDAAEKRDLLERLSEVETFERFLHTTPPFQGQKRFSIEGCDMMVPILDAIMRCTAKAGTREVTIGMAHRGRLNVLAHVLGKPYAAILSEFPNPNSTGEKPAESGTGSLGYSGDVKYHLGHRRVYIEAGVKEMPITLAPNPSHLEFVNPVVVGRARAAQEKRDQPGTPVQDPKASLAILIHGDAAFPGQGVVAETLNLSQLPGYAVGGTIHLIANNQIGFTTTPKDGRSTMYASDLAKGFEIPIVHVNADDPHACIAVARMACAYRERFGKDFLIDLIGYRRWGHNEVTSPAFTQPRLYETIRAHPTVRELWAKTLENDQIVTPDEAEAFVTRVQQRLTQAKTQGTATPLPAPAVAPPDAAAANGSGNGTGEKNASGGQAVDAKKTVSVERTARAERRPARAARRLHGGRHPRQAVPCPAQNRARHARTGQHQLGARRGARLRFPARRRHADPPDRPGYGARHVRPAQPGSARPDDRNALLFHAGAAAGARRLRRPQQRAFRNRGRGL